MIFSNESTHPKELLNLYCYLQERPGCIIDSQKLQRQLGFNHKLLEELFTELELGNIGIRLKTFHHSNFPQPQTRHSKFYFYGEKYLLPETNYRPDQSGAIFEQKVFIKIFKLVANIWFMRTSTGIEVDFIIQTNEGKYIALELQKDQFIYAADLQGLHFFHKEFPLVEKLAVLHMGERDNKEGAIWIMPYSKLLNFIKE